MENAAELAKIYETQEKEKQIAEQKAELTKHKNILIAVVVLLVIGVTFIAIVLRFNRRVNRRNKTIVATINQMMQKDDQLTRLQLTDDTNKADNIDPEEIRLKQSLEMLKDDKSIEEIVTECGYRDANDFGRKFYDHFGIHAEEYRKWSKNMSKEEKTGIEEANQMKQSFIRNMSHEIRTPLNQIYGFVQLLTTPGMQLSDEDKQRFTGIIGEQTSHMTQMLNTFLEISQYESSNEPLPVETVNIDEVLTLSCSSFMNIKDGVELSFKNNSGLETLECNNKGLLRILHCIIDNAIKFTDKGYVSVECASNADGNIVFSVTDTGKGIPEGDEERIFEQFYKVDEFIPGTGLGLSLARVIADRMGATIAVDRSYKAQGSRFNITLKNKRE
ncbi:MAG: ATP-binding protein [Prevotella sp.]